MLLRTHLSIAFFLSLFLVTYMEYKALFLVAFFVATVLPDADTSRSYVGRKFPFNLLGWFVKHRGFLHSLLFLAVVSFLLFVVNTSFGFGFFLGYALHLLLDASTGVGVQIFWPAGFRLRGPLKSAGLFEEVLFVVFLLGSVVKIVLAFV